MFEATPSLEAYLAKFMIKKLLAFRWKLLLLGTTDANLKDFDTLLLWLSYTEKKNRPSPIRKNR